MYVCVCVCVFKSCKLHSSHVSKNLGSKKKRERERGRVIHMVATLEEDQKKKQKNTNFRLTPLFCLFGVAGAAAAGAAVSWLAWLVLKSGPAECNATRVYKRTWINSLVCIYVCMHLRMCRAVCTSRMIMLGRMGS